MSYFHGDTILRLLVQGLTTLLVTFAALAQQPGPAYEVIDLSLGEQNGDAFDDFGILTFQPVEFAGTFYFAADHPSHGIELWQSDGAPEGTRLSADICPGPCSSRPGDFLVLGERLYFTADNGVHGKELFALSPGGSPGLFADVCPGRCPAFSNSSTRQLHAVADQLFLVATDGLTGVELRVLGTRRQARLVADLCPGSCGSFFRQFLATAEHLFFITHASGQSEQIYRAGRAAAGATPLVAGDTLLGRAGDQVVASGFLEGVGRVLLALGETSDRPRTIALQSSREALGEFGGELYYKAGQTLFRTDGTTQGTRVALGLDVDPRYFAVADQAMFFFADDGAGVFLWTSDGSPAGTRAVTRQTVQPGPLAAAGERVYFFQPGDELWGADRESAELLHVLDAASTGLTAAGGRLFFTARDDATGREPWTSDGTAAGTTMLADIHRGPVSTRLDLLTATAERLVFVADGRVHRSDGTAEGTVRVDEGPVIPTAFFPFDGALLYCGGFFPVAGLWQTDGTPEGTFLRAPDLDGCTGFTDLGTGDVVFAAGLYDPNLDASHVELWASDGTAVGTRLVRDVDPSTTGFPVRPISSHPRELTRIDDGVVLFTATQLGDGGQLWRTDGTRDGTRGVRSLCPERPCRSDPEELVRFGRRAIFSAYRPDDGREPWISNGRARGTRRLANLNPGSLGSNPHGFTVLGNRVLFFALQDGSESLFKTDGTTRGTRRVRELGFGGLPSLVIEARRVEDQVFFTLHHHRTGTELWKTDGTARGTRLVKQIAEGHASASPSELTAVDGVLVFAASDGVHGKELWVSDGAAEGTRMLQDLEPGAGSSAPRSFTAQGDLLYFVADTASGNELWAMPRTALLAP